VLEDADRRKDEFLAMLAHELRNPLAPIRNAAHTLGLLGPGDDRLRWVSGVIERQVGLMTRLVDDLLDVSRITSGKIALQREVVSVRAVLAQAVEAARPAVESRTQALEMDVPEDAGWVDGDPARLAQAVGNLLDNAIKYTPKEARIEIMARLLDTGELEMAVRDNGPGIPAEDLPHIFERFYRVDKGRSRETGGTGLGLSIVKHIVQLHGGRVWAESEVGQGTSIFMRLPRRADHAVRDTQLATD
jgi:signal transduction histidine kinase